MEKRQSRRITGGYKVELISGGTKHPGEVENLSEYGLCVVLFPLTIPVEFEPEQIYDVNFYLFTDETFNFQCKVKWIKEAASHGLTFRIGMEIIDPQWDKSRIFV